MRPWVRAIKVALLDHRVAWNPHTYRDGTTLTTQLNDETVYLWFAERRARLRIDNVTVPLTRSEKRRLAGACAARLHLFYKTIRAENKIKTAVAVSEVKKSSSFQTLVTIHPSEDGQHCGHCYSCNNDEVRKILGWPDHDFKHDFVGDGSMVPKRCPSCLKAAEEYLVRMKTPAQ
jgi:hypothetical protein